MVIRDRKKAGQVTLFIILAIIIVASILVFFLYLQPNFFSVKSEKLYLESCVEGIIQDSINKLSLTAGNSDPSFNAQYLGENISIVCYSDEYYKPCVVQQASFKQTFEESLAKETKTQIEKCYKDSVRELQAKGYEVTEGNIKQTFEINPDGVKVTVNAPTTVSSGEVNSRQEKFEIKYNSDIYKILMIATSILQYETSYGDSEVSTFMYLYPELNVQKIRSNDGIKIYIITDKNVIEFKFAVRSYAWPPGYGVS